MPGNAKALLAVPLSDDVGVPPVDPPNGGMVNPVDAVLVAAAAGLDPPIGGIPNALAVLLLGAVVGVAAGADGWGDPNAGGIQLAAALAAWSDIDAVLSEMLAADPPDVDADALGFEPNWYPEAADAMLA